MNCFYYPMRFYGSMHALDRCEYTSGQLLSCPFPCRELMLPCHGACHRRFRRTSPMDWSSDLGCSGTAWCVVEDRVPVPVSDSVAVPPIMVVGALGRHFVSSQRGSISIHLASRHCIRRWGNPARVVPLPVPRQSEVLIRIRICVSSGTIECSSQVNVYCARRHFTHPWIRGVGRIPFHLFVWEDHSSQLGLLDCDPPWRVSSSYRRVASNDTIVKFCRGGRDDNVHVFGDGLPFPFFFLLEHKEQTADYTLH